MYCYMYGIKKCARVPWGIEYATKLKYWMLSLKENETIER